MARKIEKLVNTLEVRKTKVQVFYDPARRVFTGTFGGHRYDGADQAEAEAALIAAVQAASQVTWFPVIEAEREFKKNGKWGGLERSVTVGLDLNRFWVAVLAPGKHAKLGWEQMERADRHGESMGARLEWAAEFYWKDTPIFQVPYSRKESVGWGKYQHFLPYTEELWQALHQIANAFEEANTRLETLLGTEDGLLLLAQQGSALLLPAGAGAPIEEG